MPYLKKYKVKDVLTEDKALSVLEDYFCKKNRGLRISTHANGTLSVEEMKAILNTWEQQDGWVADIIIVDYADLLTTKGNQEERHKQNNIWKALRGLNQETNTLLITATQSDAAAYEQDTLRLKNFSEDKRKYAHVTAFYGLNQDSKGREKNLGVLRINELLLREDGFDANRQVTVLQAMSIGRPILTSYW
jgi:archaellum biogenesis ATPase FlaH